MSTVENSTFNPPEFYDRYEGSQMRALVQELESLYARLIAPDLRRYDWSTAASTPFSVNAQEVIVVDDDTIGGAAAVDLPTAESRESTKVTIIKSGNTGNVTVSADGSETIDGAATASLTTQYQSITLFSDGAEWFSI